MEIKGDVIKFELHVPELVNGEAFISNGLVIFKFSNTDTAKKCYDYEKSIGNKNVRYHLKTNSYIEIYRGKSKDKIREFILKKFNDAGGKQVESGQ